MSLIRRAAPLHDVGKIGIPDAILLKLGKLTDEEFALVKTHTTIGARILSGSRFRLLRLAEEIAFSHHERWDGERVRGDLNGDAIPLAGRIVAVADVFDALTQKRPYKAAWPVGRSDRGNRAAARPSVRSEAGRRLPAHHRSADPLACSPESGLKPDATLDRS